MMSPTQFAELKRDICQRLMAEIPDAALGELIATMREMIDHYGTHDAEVKARVEAETANAATLTPPQANIPEPKKDKPVTNPTVPSRRTIVAGLNRTTPMKQAPSAPKQLPVPPVPAPEASADEVATEPTKPEAADIQAEASKESNDATPDRFKKAVSMARPADFADQLKKAREEKAKAVAEARRLQAGKKASNAS